MCLLTGVFVIEPLEEMLSRTATPRKPSAGSGTERLASLVFRALVRSAHENPAAHLRSSWFERASLSHHHERRSAPFERLRSGAYFARVPGARLALSVLQARHRSPALPLVARASLSLGYSLPAGRLRKEA